MDEILWCYFHMVLFIQYVALTLEFVDEILWCYHSCDTSLAELLHNAIHVLKTIRTFDETSFAGKQTASNALC